MNFIEKIHLAAKEGKLLQSTVTHLIQWLEADYFPPYVTESIHYLIDQSAWNELNDRFYRYMTFGTGGIRGRTIGKIVTTAEKGKSSTGDCPEYSAVGSNNLNDFQIIRATIGLFRYTEKYLYGNKRYQRPRLVIAHDVRYFSRYFCELSASTWIRLGGDALIFSGPRSTPQLSFSVRRLKAHAGVVLTASHNPYHDNGFKAYFEDGGQVVSPHAEGIIDAVMETSLKEVVSYLEIELKSVQVLGPDLDDDYQNKILNVVLAPKTIADEKPKIVFSAIHGTGAVTSVPAMKSLGINVISVPEQTCFDGRFTTVKSPNPENSEALSKSIEKGQETNADAVIATDPDADRMGVAVPSDCGDWVLLTGNVIGSLLAESRIRALKAARLLNSEKNEKSVLIKTFVTTPMQEAIALKHGLRVVNTLTGFKWIGAKLAQYQKKLVDRIFDELGIALDYDKLHWRKKALLLQEFSTFYVFGGEESYGYLPDDAVRDKDANAAVLLFCELVAILKSQGKTVLGFLDEMYLEYGYFTEKLINIYYPGASGSQKITSILDSYRNQPPESFAGIAVKQFIDFGRDTITDSDGDVIPNQDFYFLKLANGDSFAVRSSGTEPKIKFYIFAQESLDNEMNLIETKKITQERIINLATEIEKDARNRANL